MRNGCAPGELCRRSYDGENEAHHLREPSRPCKDSGSGHLSRTGNSTPLPHSSWATGEARSVLFLESRTGRRTAWHRVVAGTHSLTDTDPIEPLGGVKRFRCELGAGGTPRARFTRRSSPRPLRLQ